MRRRSGAATNQARCSNLRDYSHRKQIRNLRSHSGLLAPASFFICPGLQKRPRNDAWALSVLSRRLRNHLKDEFKQGGKLVPENPKDDGEKLVPVQPKDGTDGHDALGLRGAGTRGALDQRLDNKVLLCTGQVLAVQNPFDPRRESHDFWTTGANGMKHGAESM